MNGVNYQDFGGNLIDTSGQHTYDQSNQTAIQNSGRLCSSDEITSFLTNKILPLLSNYNSMAACTSLNGAVMVRDAMGRVAQAASGSSTWMS